jgi:hypothetical protein
MYTGVSCRKDKGKRQQGSEESEQRKDTIRRTRAKDGAKIGEQIARIMCRRRQVRRRAERGKPKERSKGCKQG